MTVRLPVNSAASRANRFRRLQQQRFVVVNPSAVVDSPAKTQYVFCDPIYFITLYPEFLAVLLILSGMLDLCMLVFVFIMIYLFRNLIMQLPMLLLYLATRRTVL